MTQSEVLAVVSKQIEAGLDFENLHGISPANLESFLVEPYEATVDPDDLETSPRPMWVVLHERNEPREGYVVVFDPRDSCWGVAEFTHAEQLTLVASASSLSGALSGM